MSEKTIKCKNCEAVNTIDSEIGEGQRCKGCGLKLFEQTDVFCRNCNYKLQEDSINCSSCGLLTKLAKWIPNEIYIKALEWDGSTRSFFEEIGISSRVAGSIERGTRSPKEFLELCSKNEYSIYAIRNFGEKSLDEIKNKFNEWHKKK